MWTFANISEKIGEVTPTCAYFYTARTIVFVSIATGIIAALAHATPDAIQNAVGSAVTILTKTGIFVATARSYSAVSETSGWQGRRLSAITSAQPQIASVVIFAPCPFDRNESTKTLTCNILWLGHWTAPIGLRQVARSVLRTPASPRLYHD